MDDTPRASVRTTATRFVASMTMEQAILVDPRVQQVLREFHIGGCQACGFEAGDTIEKVALDNGIPVQRMLDRLHQHCAT